MRISILSLTLLAFSALALGCQDAGPLPEAAPVTQAEYATATAVHPDLKRPLTDEEVERMVGENLRGRVAMERVVRSAATWQEADAGIRALLAEAADPHVQYVREQSAAAIMLRTHLLQGTATAEKQQALKHYTQLLVANRSPEASLIADALARLEGHVEDARLAEMAADAITAAEAYLAEQIGCDDCSGAVLQERVGPALGGRILAGHQSVVDGIEALRAISAQSGFGA